LTDQAVPIGIIKKKNDGAKGKLKVEDIKKGSNYGKAGV
jgi:hypothetical protein